MKLFPGEGHPPSQRQRQRQRGQTITEYLIILPVLLLLILGVIQYAFIYQAKVSLNYATFMGARQGALKGGNLRSIKDGVAAGMTPFFMRTNTTPNFATMGIARSVAMIEIFNPGTATVQIISPTQEAFDGFSEDGAIPNDNLMFRQNAGLHGDMSIQDANLLKIRVTYCVKLNVPVVNRVIYAMSAGIAGIQNLADQTFWDSSSESTPTACSMTTDKWAPVRGPVNEKIATIPTTVTIPLGPLGSTDVPVPVDLQGLATGLTDKAFNLLPQKAPRIPGLDWDIEGMRIPITAEAIIRMQSPFKF
jgi:hypothetical protein